MTSFTPHPVLFHYTLVMVENREKLGGTWRALGCTHGDPKGVLGVETHRGVHRDCLGVLVGEETEKNIEQRTNKPKAASIENKHICTISDSLGVIQISYVDFKNLNLSNDKAVC